MNDKEAIHSQYKGLVLEGRRRSNMSEIEQLLDDMCNVGGMEGPACQDMIDDAIMKAYEIGKREATDNGSQFGIRGDISPEYP